MELPLLFIRRGRVVLQLLHCQPWSNNYAPMLDLFYQQRKYSELQLFNIQFTMIRLVVGLLLLQIITADSIITNNVDFVESISQNNIALLERVEKKVDVRYPISLVGDNAWHPFPEMNLIFELPFPQYVKTLYNLNVASSPQAHMEIHYLVDGVENRDFRGHYGYNYHPGLFRSGEMYLEAGRHQVILEYRMINAAVTPDYDWTSAIFKVDYFKRVQ